jgi:hypothetical protein
VATVNITEAQDGLASSWPEGAMTWVNPPFHRHQVAAWIKKLAAHGNGIALVHARTETEWFQPIWDHADGILFLGQRVTFCKPDGTLCTVTNARTGKVSVANSGAPVVIAAFGPAALCRLRKSTSSARPSKAKFGAGGSRGTPRSSPKGVRWASWFGFEPLNAATSNSVGVAATINGVPQHDPLPFHP